MASAIRLRDILKFLHFDVIKLNIIPTKQEEGRGKRDVTDTFEIFRQTRAVFSVISQGNIELTGSEAVKNHLEKTS